MSRKLALSKILLIAWSVIMTGLMLIFGAAPLRVLKRFMGGGPYLCLTFGLGIVFWLVGFKALAIIYASLSLTMAIYDEVEDLNHSPFNTLLIASTLSYGILAVAFGLWAARHAGTWSQEILSVYDGLLTNLTLLGPKEGLGITAQQLFMQTPSLAFMIVYLSCVCGLVGHRLFRWVEIEGPSPKWPSLYSFRVPDWVVWIFIGSFLLSFGNFKLGNLEPIAQNLFNVSLCIYFIQGLGVLGGFFDYIRMAPMWRFLIYFLAVVQLSLFVGGLGLLDYWFDFRTRLIKRTSELKKKSMGEN